MLILFLFESIMTMNAEDVLEFFTSYGCCSLDANSAEHKHGTDEFHDDVFLPSSTQNPSSNVSNPETNFNSESVNPKSLLPQHDIDSIPAISAAGYSLEDEDTSFKENGKSLRATSASNSVNCRPSEASVLETLCIDSLSDEDPSSSAPNQNLPLSPVSDELNPLLESLELIQNQPLSPGIGTIYSFEKSNPLIISPVTVKEEIKNIDEVDIGTGTDPKDVYHLALKQELKFKIKLRRSLSNQEEITIEEKDTRKLNSESMTKPQESRKERNRFHAKISRERFKRSFLQLMQNDKVLRDENQQLEDEIKKLMTKVSTMESWLQVHSKHCKVTRHHSF